MTRATTVTQEIHMQLELFIWRAKRQHVVVHLLKTRPGSK